MPVSNLPALTMAVTPAAVGTSGGTVGFYAVTPVARPAAYTQTYETAARSHPAMTSADVATTASGLAIFGYTQAQADSIPVAINAARADILAVKDLLNSVIDDLQAVGLLQ